MPNEKKPKTKCVEYLRHAEYYDMQSTFDELYARSQAGEIFDNLMDVILSRENILLAYRNIKSNTGSITPGTDKLKISDIGKLTADEVTARVRKIVKGAKNGYTPRSVRRKDIPKPNGNTRPLGIPCIWDRLVQQCIKQVMEPICEARFSNNSYGFRPNRSVENAIAATYRLMQKSGLRYVVEFDIKGFFDNVDHSKLIKQLWSLNIRDKELLYVIRRILKAPILMPDGHTEHPTKGTPQGGIISPLLANVVLNELDHWIESQWQCNPVTENYAYRENAAGCPIQSHAYRAMRNTRLKEMYIVRYADDFRILCRTREQADRTLIAVTQWLKERLRLDVSPEKTRVVDVRRSYSEFLGFKIRLRKKGKKYVVQSHMCDKAYKKVKASLTKQVGNIKFPRKGRGEAGEVRLFNSMVMGIQNYYQLATDISIDCGDIGRTVNTVLKNRLKSGKTHRLKKEGRDLTKMEIQRYGKSEQLRYIAQSKEPIYPISYVQCKNPMSQRRKVCAYTAAGRSEIHDDLRINTFLLLQLMRAPTYSRSTEYADQREMYDIYQITRGNRVMFGSPVDLNWHNSILYGYGYQCSGDIVIENSQMEVLVPSGTPVLSVMDGQVVRIASGIITLRNEKGYTVKIGGCTNFTVPVGTEVTKGQPIAKIGSAGKMTLSFSYRNNCFNPYFYLNVGSILDSVEVEATGKAAQLIAKAEQYLGTPYVWGGYSPSGFDCSGFVSYVVNNCGAGFNFGRLTAERWRQQCSIISASQARPGDLIFFQGTYNTSGASHVGIYLGDGKMIHCGNPVKISSINTAYWQQHFYCYGRIPGM